MKKNQLETAVEQKDGHLAFAATGMVLPVKLFKIGEIIHYTGISRQTLHNYTMLGLISEAERTKSGHRLYPELVFQRLAKIERLKRHHTLQEVKEMLDKEEVKNS